MTTQHIETFRENANNSFNYNKTVMPEDHKTCVICASQSPREICKCVIVGSKH